jgi:hypothetical protein
MKQDKWIKQVLNSTNGITKVEPNDLLFSKIEKRIQDNNAESKSSLWLAAASITIFLSLSFIIVQMNSASKRETNSSFNEQFSVNNQLYK